MRAGRHPERRAARHAAYSGSADAERGAGPRDVRSHRRGSATRPAPRVGRHAGRSGGEALHQADDGAQPAGDHIFQGRKSTVRPSSSRSSAGSRISSGAPWKPPDHRGRWSPAPGRQLRYFGCDASIGRSTRAPVSAACSSAVTSSSDCRASASVTGSAVPASSAAW